MACLEIWPTEVTTYATDSYSDFCNHGEISLTILKTYLSILHHLYKPVCVYTACDNTET